MDTHRAKAPFAVNSIVLHVTHSRLMRLAYYDDGCRATVASLCRLLCILCVDGVCQY